MPKILVVGNSEFEIPIQGEGPDYGESLTDFFEAISKVLSTVQQPNDLVTQSATIFNNQVTAVNINGFTFNTAQVLTINAEYIVKRTTVSPAVSLVESGSIKGNFDGANWSISREQVGDSGVEFTITSAGQIQYTSSNLTGTSYTGQISYKAKVFNQA